MLQYTVTNNYGLISQRKCYILKDVYLKEYYSAPTNFFFFEIQPHNEYSPTKHTSENV